jgi:hypothetical protein
MIERHYRHRVDSVVSGAVSVMDALASPEKFGSQFGSQASDETLSHQP